MAMSSNGSAAASPAAGCATRIRFCVSVPVLSVQMTVTAPMVSHECSFLTRLFDRSMRRMLSARASVTAIGSPSGTAITMSVTAIMKYLSTIWAMCM